MKKTISFFLTIILSMVLISCGETTETNGTSTTNKREFAGTYTDVVNYEDQGTLVFDANDDVMFNDVEINLHTISSGKDLVGVENMATKFNKEFAGKIKVTVTYEGQNSYYDTLTRRISTDVSVPELCMFHNEYFPSLQMSHLFQPIDRIIDMAKLDVSMDDFYDGVKDNCYVGDTLYGLPCDSHSEVMIYRKDLLRKYNLELPTNYEELVNAAYTIQTGEAKDEPTFQGLSLSTEQFGIYYYTFFTAILQNNGKLADEGWPCWNDPGSKEAISKALEKFNNLFYGPKPISKHGLAVTDPNTFFAKGDAAFALVYTWELNDVINSYELMCDADYNDWGVLPLSGLFADDNTQPYANTIYGISHEFLVPKSIKDVNKKAAAVFFANWYTENQAPEWTSTGHVPMNKNCFNSSEYKDAPSTIRAIGQYGQAENYVNFPYVYYQSPMLDGLAKIFLFSTRKAGTNTDTIIKKYHDEATMNIEAIIS